MKRLQNSTHGKQTYCRYSTYFYLLTWTSIFEISFLRLIRKGATLAMYTLPTKKDLVKRVSDEQMEMQHIQEILNEVIDYSKRIYDQCEKLYIEHELTELP